REIAPCRPDKHARYQPPLSECSDVGVLCALVPAASGHVGDDARRHRLVCPRFQFLEAHRWNNATQARKVNLVLVISEVGHGFLRRLMSGYIVRSFHKIVDLSADAISISTLGGRGALLSRPVLEFRRRDRLGGLRAQFEKAK